MTHDDEFPSQRFAEHSHFTTPSAAHVGHSPGPSVAAPSVSGMSQRG